jgi:hypothetical protein
VREVKTILAFTLLLTGCYESIDHDLDGGGTHDSGFDAGFDAGTDRCHEDGDCPCAQTCIGHPLSCTPFTPTSCDATTQCDHVVPGSTCTASMRLGSFCGYHACLLPDGGP